MLTKKESYEAARVEHKLAMRRLHQAVDQKLGEPVLTRLRFEVEQAAEIRRRAFEAYMNSDERAGF